MQGLLEREVRRSIQQALEEDEVHEDITSLACISREEKTEAHFLLKQKAIIAGLPFLPWIFHSVDPSVEFQFFIEEGEECSSNMILGRLRGPARSLLSLERTSLNLIQHTSAIATKTQQYVQAVKEFSCDILDTRKTIPGLRSLQKYAVKVGGGKNHRFHLKDRFLIKNNHLSQLKKRSSKPITEAIEKARAFCPGRAIEIEVETLEMLEEALAAKAEIILLDNMSLDMLTRSVLQAKGKAYLEASGGVSLDNVRDIAATGVDGISIGALTHSICAIDISLRI